VGHRSPSDCVRHRHIGVATFGHVLPDKEFGLQIWLHPSLDDKTVAVEVQVRSVTTGRATAWRSTRVYTGNGGTFAGSGGWKTVSVRAPRQTGLYEVRTHVSWENVRPLAVLTASVSGAEGTAPSAAVSESTVLSVGNCGTSSQDAALFAYLNGTFGGGPIVNPTDGQPWSGNSTNPFSINVALVQGGINLTFSCAWPQPRASFELETPFGYLLCNSGSVMVTTQQLWNAVTSLDGCSAAPASDSGGFVCNLLFTADGPGGPFADEIALPITEPVFPSNSTTFVPTLDLATMTCD